MCYFSRTTQVSIHVLSEHLSYESSNPWAADRQGKENDKHPGHADGFSRLLMSSLRLMLE